MAEELAGPAAYSYNLTVETPIDIDELIYVLTPADLPWLHGINSDGIPVMSRIPVGNTSFNWLEENVPLPRTTLLSSMTNVATTTTLASGGAVKFAVGDGIRIDDEVMIITAIDTTTETITVTRGSAAETNTTAASHNAGADVIGLGSILVEGAIGSGNFQGRDKYSNYTQIWTKKLQMSRTEQAIKKYGVPSELARQTRNMMQHTGTGMEQAAIYGVKHEHATTKRRQTGGVWASITTNVDSSTEWLTVDAIEDRQQVAYNLGGVLDFAMAAPSAFGALNNSTGAERISTVSIDDARRGRRRASTIITEFGELLLVRNRFFRSTDAILANQQNVVYRDFQPMVLQKLAKTDDTDSWLFVAEGGFEIKGQDHMAKFTALNPSAAMPADLV